MAPKTKTSQRKRPDKQLIGAVSHPIRLEALRILCYRVASPNEISQELNESVSLVSHHVKVLLEMGCIELVKTEPRRGAVEHFYRAIVPTYMGDESWRELPKSKRREVSQTVLQALIGELVRAVKEDTFDAREDRHLSWAPISVDEEGWKELVERQNELLEDLNEIKTKSAERLAGEAGQRVVVAMMGFETPPGFGFADAER